jgi:hypothetical protein
VTPLPHGKSFNNRLYYLHVKLSQHNDLTEAFSFSHEIDLVLKVNGRFFGASKIQNEVACLCMLREHAVDTPSPCVIAWSDNGSSINRVVADGSGMKVLHGDSTSDKISRYGWILMTRMKGNPISLDAISKENLEDVALQLARIVAKWRKCLQPAVSCGNIAIVDAGESRKSPFTTVHSSISGLSFAVGTCVLTSDLRFSMPVSDTYDYYRLKFEGRLNKLKTVDCLKENRHLVPHIRKFIDIDLSRLQTFTHQHNRNDMNFVFTHYDLAPRNIIVTGNPPQITGIVDFEFAGFFPDMDEFLNDANNNSGDWPPLFYSAYLRHLEILGVATPLSGFAKHTWEQANTLTRLEEHIAPWWLESGEADPEELKTELRKAEHVVIDAVARLGNA